MFQGLFQVRFPLFDYAGRVVDYYVAESVELDAGAPAPAPAHRVFVVDASGSMTWDIEGLKAMLEKVLTVDEFKSPRLVVTLITYSGVGDVVCHFSRVPIVDVMAPGSAHLLALRAVRTRGLTCISQALAMAATLIRDDETTAISLHSDGYANDRSPTEERRAIAAVVDTLRSRPRAFVDCVAYRDGADFALLSSVANACSGSCVQARTVAQVYEALAAGTRAVAGASSPALTIASLNAYVVFVSRKARKVLGSAEDLLVRGLAADDDRSAWRLRVVTAAAYRKLRCPVATDPDGDLLPMLLYARALIAEGHLTRAKYLIASTRLALLTARSTRAMTAPQVAGVAGDLDAVIYGEPDLQQPGAGDVVAPMHFADVQQTRFVAEPDALTRDVGVPGALGPGVLDVAQAIARHPRGLLVDLPRLAAGYRRSGIKRVPGVRLDSGAILPPLTDVTPRDAGPWVEVLGAEVNTTAATINLLTSRAVDVVDRVTRAHVHEVAGVKLDAVRTFNNYTLVSDGELNVAQLHARIVDKALHAQLQDLGVVVGAFDPDVERTIDLDALPVVSLAADVEEPTLHQVEALQRLTVLSRLLAACRKGAPGRFSAEQAAELKRHGLTPALHYSPTTTYEFADRAQAIAAGVIDARTSYTIAIGTAGVLSPDDLYGANEYLQRRFIVEGPQGPLAKPTMLDAVVAPPGAVKAKPLTKATKLNAVDVLTWPIFVAFLSAIGHSIEGGPVAPMEHYLREDVGLSAAQARLVCKELAAPATRGDAIAGALRLVDVAVEAAWSALRPLVFTIGASGIMPESTAAKALDADGLIAAVPGTTLTKAQRAGTFHLCPSRVVISVYAEPAWYSTGRALPAA